jgi:hypothetical protein
VSALGTRAHRRTSGLDTERQRGDIEQQEVVGRLRASARQDRTLDSRTVGDGLIRVQRAAQLLAAEELLQERLHLRDTSGTTDQDDIVDLRRLQLTILEDLLHRLQALGEVDRVERLELRARQGVGEVDQLRLSLAALGRDGEQRLDVDLSLLGLRELTLGRLGSGLETAHHASIAGHIRVAGRDGLLHEEASHGNVEVLSTEASITAGSLDLRDTAINGEDGDIKGTTTEIEDEDARRLLLVQAIETVRERRGGRLVDDAEDIESGDATSGLGGGTLRVVEVRRDGDDGLWRQRQNTRKGGQSAGALPDHHRCTDSVG